MQKGNKRGGQTLASRPNPYSRIVELARALGEKGITPPSLAHSGARCVTTAGRGCGEEPGKGVKGVSLLPVEPRGTTGPLCSLLWLPQGQRSPSAHGVSQAQLGQGETVGITRTALEEGEGKAQGPLQQRISSSPLTPSNPRHPYSPLGKAP